jgi:M6 family metalloprotease-like protein/PGF-pre-PGF domain-containing protein
MKRRGIRLAFRLAVAFIVLFAALLAFGCLDFFQPQPAQPSGAPPGVIAPATPPAGPRLVVAVTPTPAPSPTPAALENQLKVDFKEIPPAGCLTEEDKQEISEITPISGGIRVRQGFLLSDPCWTTSVTAVQKGSLVTVSINATHVTPPREAVGGVICIPCVAIKTIEANVSIASGVYDVEVVLLIGSEKKTLSQKSGLEVESNASLEASSGFLLAPPAPWVKGKPPKDAVFQRQGKKKQAGVAGAPGFEGAGAFAPVIGTRNIIALLVQFPGDMNRSTSGCDGGECTQAYFNNSLFGSGNSSLRAYYYENSYGQLNLTGSAYAWLNLTRNMSYYGSGTPGTSAQFCALLNDSVFAADASVDFSCYPNCTVMIIHAGNGQESSGTDADIWSNSVSECTAASVDGVSITSGIITPETEASSAVPFGVMAHEYAHALGAPDLYNTLTGDAVVGFWDLMDSGSWTGSPAGSNPTHLSAWNKILLGWATPYVVNYTGSKLLTMLALASNATGTKIVKMPALTDSSQEYFLIENRQAAAGAFDAAAPESGVLIWHVDDSIGTLSLNDINNYATKRVIPEDQNPGTTTLNDAAFTAGQVLNSTTSPNSSRNDGTATGIAASRLSTAGTNYTIAVNNNDTIKPGVAILAPQNSSMYYSKASIPLNYSATDLLGVEWTGYSRDGAANVTLTGNTTFSVSQDGSHNITLYANDTAGNTNLSAVFFSVNSTPPRYYNLSAAPSSPVNYSASQVYFFNSTWLGVVGNVSTVLLELNGTNYTAANYSAQLGGGSYYVNFTGLNAGNYSYLWHANDTLGNWNSTAAANYNVSTLATSLSQAASPSSPEVNGTNVTFACNYSSNGSLVNGAMVYVNMDGANYTANYSPSGYLYWNSTLSFGNHSWYCIANKTNYDSKTTAAENYTTATLVVKLYAPANGSIYLHNTSTLSLSFVQRDWLLQAANCSLYLNGALNQTNSSTPHNATTTFNISFTARNNTWYVNCTDPANETGVSETRVFSWTNAAPTLNNVTSSAYLVNNGSAVNISSDALASDADNDSLYLRCGNASATYNLCNGNASYGTGTRSCNFTWPYADNINRTIYCSLFDGLNASQEYGLNITSDNLAPAINSAWNSPNSSFKGRIFIIYANVTEANQVSASQAVIKLPDGTNTTQNMTLSSGFYSTSYYTYSNSQNGTYSIDLNFSDSTGNVNYSSNAASFSVWNVSASINATASASTVCVGSSSTISGYALLSNGTPVQNYAVDISGAASGSTTTSSSGSYSTSVAVGGAGGAMTVALSGTMVNTSVTVTTQACPTPTPTPTPTTSPGGGGGGGGGGGAAPAKVTSVDVSLIDNGASITISNITKDKPLEFYLSKEATSKTDVLTVNLTLSTEPAQVSVRIESISERPASVPEPAVNALPVAVYRYLNITKEAFENEDVKSAEITFRVDKVWLSQMRAKPDDMALARFNETAQAWETLATRRVLQTADYYEYRASSPGFSVFAIVATSIRPAPSPTPTPTPGQNETASPTPTPGAATTPSPSPVVAAGFVSSDQTMLLLAIASLLIIAPVLLVVALFVLPKLGVKLPPALNVQIKGPQSTFAAVKSRILATLHKQKQQAEQRVEQKAEQKAEQQARAPAEKPAAEKPASETAAREKTGEAKPPEPLEEKIKKIEEKIKKRTKPPQPPRESEHAD